MASTSHIDLHVPPDLYMRIQDAAARSGRSVEAMLLESLDLLFGASSADWDRLAAMLDALSDAQLWALVYRRLVWADGARLRELTSRGKQGPLMDEEQRELAALIDDADRLTLLRSRALLVLQERGHDVQNQFRLGA